MLNRAQYKENVGLHLLTFNINQNFSSFGKLFRNNKKKHEDFFLLKKIKLTQSQPG